MGSVIAAFGEEHIERLTGISRAQLRHWNRTDFFCPSFGLGVSSAPFTRVYSFRDVVALRVLNTLRNQFRVPLQHLRAVSGKLSHLAEDRWTGVKLWVLNRKVVWEEPGTGKPQDILSGQYVVPVVLEVVADDTRDAIAKMNVRDVSIQGVVQKSRHIGHNVSVFSGTRIPIAAVQRYLAAGYEVAQIRSEYPELTEKDIHFAKGYSAALAA